MQPTVQNRYFCPKDTRELLKYYFSIALCFFCLPLNGQSPVRDTLNGWLDRAIKLYDRGDYANSAEIALKCLTTAEKAQITGIAGKAYYCLARGAFQLQDFDKGLAYARAGLEASRKEKDTEGIAHAYNITAVLMLATNRLDSAYYYGDQAVQHYQKAGNRQGAAIAYTKMGHVFNIKGAYEKATPYYLRSYEMARYDTLSSAFMTANLCLASNYIYLKKPDAALPHTLKSYQIARALHLFYEQSTSLLYLSGIYEQKGDYRTALKYQRQYTEIRDSVLKGERVRQVKELEAQYEAVKKENAIALLEKEKLQQRVVIWAGLAILAVLLFVALQMYSSYRRRTIELRAESRERERLNEMDAFKSRFFTNITHEFRTPLTVILGNLELMKTETERAVTDKSVSGFMLSKISAVKRAGENLLRLINEILDLAKLESDTLQLNYVQGDVLAYLRYIAESMYSLANLRNVLLRVESDQASIVMDYDPERLLQIIHNLFSNAIKFTPSGGRVTLQAELHAEATPVLHIVVTDTGAGIAPEDLPHIFDRFFQAKNQQIAALAPLGRAGVGSGGSGIGLSLTKELVKVMGGDIRVESTVGKGTVFTVTLPVANNAPGAEHFPETPLSGQSVAPARQEPATGDPSSRPQLLIVEDNPDVVEYLGACLYRHYQLDFAYNGRAGIEKAQENVPDIIISDVMMPEKDGFELCDTLKNDERTSHIPIILLTARATAADRIAGLRRGADAYLAKPFQPDELLVTLANLVALRRRLQERYAQISAPLPPAAEPGLQIEDAFLQKVRALVDSRLSDPDLEMPQLERALAMSRSQIFRKIKALTGKSPSLFIRSIRLARAQELLRTTARTVSEIAYDTGFSSPQYFSDAFLEEFGIRPSDARAGV